MRPNDLPEDGELNGGERSFNQGWALLGGGRVGEGVTVAAFHDPKDQTKPQLTALSLSLSTQTHKHTHK